MFEQHGKKERVPYFSAGRQAAARPSRAERWLPDRGLGVLSGFATGTILTIRQYEELEMFVTSALFQALLEQRSLIGLSR